MMFRFRLYVTGDTENSAAAIANLNELCREHMADQHEIEVVDLAVNPERALTDGIFMTPTLIKLSPSPTRMIVGTLNNERPVLQALGLLGAMKASVIKAVLLFAVVMITGCDAIDNARSRFGKATTDTIQTATGSGLALGLQAPPTLRQGDAGVLRLSLANQSDTVVRLVRLELIVPDWAEPGAPQVGDRPVSIAPLTTGNTQFTYRFDDAPLNPGQTQNIQQRIRVPDTGIKTHGNAPWTRTVKARLVSPDGHTLAEVQTELAVDSSVVASVTSSPAEAPARRERLGAVELGMRLADVKQVAPTARDTTWMVAGARQRGLLVPVDGANAFAVLTNDEVTRIEVSNPAIHTAEGLGVNSQMSELRAAYGNPCIRVVANRYVVSFAGAPGAAFIINAVVNRNAALSDANAIPGTAQVSRWWLSRDVEGCASGG